MTGKTHFALQVCLLVIWVVILFANTSVGVSSQTCTQPDYMWQNPLRKFWRPNFGNVVVKIDSRFSTQYAAAHKAVTGISAGHKMWNDVTCSGVRFIDFETKQFTDAGSDDRVISADIKVR